jgi:death-on-curing protein
VSSFLSVDEVIALHDQQKLCALLNRGALESAVNQPSAGTAEGDLFYESVYMQAAVLLRGIAMAHAFEDANKRTAWVACVVFLERAGVSIRANLDQMAVVYFVVAIVTRRFTVEQIADWLINATVAG